MFLTSAVYAAGDAAASGVLRLTPVATYEGEIAAANLIEGKHVKPNYEGIPSVVFIIPPLGLHFRINKADTAAWYSSRRIGGRYSGFKVLTEEDTDRILRAHIFGHQAEEVINIFAIAIRLGLKAADIKQTVSSYPTNSSNISYMLSV